LAVVITLSLPPVKTSHPQPEPNCLAVVSLKVFLKASKSPKSAVIWSAIASGCAADAGRAHGSHQRPEGGVVGVASAVVAHDAANVFRHLGKAADEIVD